MNFTTRFDEILHQVDLIDPVEYGKTRNFIDGAVTKLSPYISRGVISTRMVFHRIMQRGYNPKDIEKFIQELAWRDYWQQVWISKGDEINNDLRRPQPNVLHDKMPNGLINAETGIDAIDQAINQFYQTGYLHNHVRMYIASLACNIGKSHWKIPAKWMYYHLLDADWASNALSWQWVAGANAGKQYLANQDNINRYCHTTQKNTYLDVSYEALENLPVPSELSETVLPELSTPLLKTSSIEIDPKKATLLYNCYNIDPNWHREEDFNRVLLLEPSVFERHPVSQKTIDFVLDLSANIKHIQVFIGEFETLKNEYGLTQFIYKEHPLNQYDGIQEPRDWMFGVTGYFPSFFGYWKHCQKELAEWNQSTLFG